MKEIIKKYSLIILLLSLLPNYSYASKIFFETKKEVNNIGDKVSLNVYLDTEGQSINAVEGKIVFSQDILSSVDILDGNSAVNFWINKPKITQNIIEYSGLTPAGIIGDKRLLFTAVFSGKNTGEAKISSTETTVLKNDGKGTKVSNSEGLISIKIGDSDANAVTPEDVQDLDAPEEFVPIVANDPSVFNGANFLVFATQDKISGMDHYEVKEGFFGTYEKAESPYLIKDQSLKKVIYVKAFDKKGNTVIMSVNRDENGALYPILLFVGIIILIIYYKRGRRSRNEHFL